MKKIFAGLFLSLFLGFTSVVQGADIPVEWKESVGGATGYEIRYSDDGGLTWTQTSGLAYTQVTEGNLSLFRATITVPDGVLVLMHVGAYRGSNFSWRVESGMYHNTLWEPANAPTGGGIN